MFNDQIKSMRPQFGVLGLLVWFVACPLWAGTVYLETFDGGAYELSGIAPDIAPADVVWEAGSEILADGTLGSQCTAYLPFEPEVGDVYEVIAEFDQDGDWAAVGFYDEEPDGDARMLENALLWGLVRENGDSEYDQAFMGPGTTDGLGNASASSAAKIRIRIETTSETEWVVTWIFDGNEDFEETINPEDYPIHYVAFGTNGYYTDVSGEILSFELRDSSNPYAASNPTPANEANDVYVQEILKWTPGDAAETRNVYLSTDMDSVTAGSDAALVAEALDVNELALDEPFELGVTYYWRVDEVNGFPDYGINEGEVWSFTAEPVGFVIDPNTIIAIASGQTSDDSGPEKTMDGSGLDEQGQHSTDSDDMWLVSLDDSSASWIQYEFEEICKLYEIEVWNANPIYESALGMGVCDANVEYSLDGNSWTSLGDPLQFNQATGTSAYTANTYVEMNGVFAKFVRITVLSQWGTIYNKAGLSEVRFYSIPTEARLPQPTDEASVTHMTVNLNWRSARDVSQHELYLGTDPNVLELVTTTTEVGYALTGLEYDRTYYWRVDEVIDEVTYSGPVWSFSTLEYVVVDDMESYDDEEGNEIFSTWVDSYDSYQSDDLGCMVGHKNTPYAEETVVHGGSQSMPYYFGVNSSTDATAEMTLDGEDWTVGGLSTLSLFVMGLRDNDTDVSLFVEINGKKRSADTYLAGGIWTQVNFDLSAFKANLSSVTSIVLGIEGSGEGQIYIDDIRLYREAATVVLPSDPGEDNLVVWYEMEDNLNDSAGTYDAASETDLSYEEGLEGFGSAVELDGAEDYVDMPIDSLVAGLGDSSLMGWIQIDEESTGSWQRLFDIGTGTENYLFISPRTSTAGNVRAAILLTDNESETGVTSDAALIEGWHHLAVVFDQGVMTLYVDGWSAGSVETEITPQDMGTTTQNWLGKSQWVDSDDLLMGMIDDFRIYNRGLSNAEIRYLAGDR